MPSPRRFRGHGPLKNSGAGIRHQGQQRAENRLVYYEDELAHENDGSP